MLGARLRDQQVDGLIVSPVDPSDEFWPELAESLAVVSIGDALPGADVAGEVLFDNRAGVTRALEHLHDLGHHRIAVLRPPGSPTNDRPAEVFVGAEADRLGLDVLVDQRALRAWRGDRRGPRGAVGDRASERGILLLGLDCLRRVRRRPRAGAHDPRGAVGDRLRQPPDLGAARLRR